MRIIAVAAFTAAALATAAPGAAQVVNGGFELGIGGTSSLTGYNGYGQSTATAWSTHNNSAGTTTTTLVAATDTLRPGGATMLAIDAEQTDNGIFQYPVALFNYVSADFLSPPGLLNLLQPTVLVIPRTSSTRPRSASGSTSASPMPVATRLRSTPRAAARASRSTMLSPATPSPPSPNRPRGAC